MAMLADMAAGKQVFRIHNDNPDRTACRTISIKSPPLRCGEKTHCVLEKKPSGLRFKEHRAARWIGFAEPATPWQCLSELRLLIWLKRWIKGLKGCKGLFLFY